MPGSFRKIKIRNVQGPPLCACGSWLKHWQVLSGQNAIYCPVPGCLDRNLVGAPVKIMGAGEALFVIPLCEFHNDLMGDVEVLDAYRLVPVEHAASK